MDEDGDNYVEYWTVEESMISIKKYESQVLSAVQSVYNSIEYGRFVYVDMVKLSVDGLENVANMREYCNGNIYNRGRFYYDDI